MPGRAQRLVHYGCKPAARCLRSGCLLPPAAGTIQITQAFVCTLNQDPSAVADEGGPIGGIGLVLAGTLAVLIGLGVLWGTGYFKSQPPGPKPEVPAAKAEPPKPPPKTSN